MLFSIFERNYNLNCSIEADQLSEYDDDSSDDNDSVLSEEDGAEGRASTFKQRTRFPFHSTKNKKRENGEDIDQGSSLAVVLNQSKKNWSNKNVFFFLWNVKCRIYCLWNVKRPLYFPSNVINT